jgi:hypothetical protein
MGTQPVDHIVFPVSAEAGIDGKEEKMRGRKPKGAKAATKIERQELLRERIPRLKDDLEAAGFGTLLKMPGPIDQLALPVQDPKTGGSFAHVEEELGTYIQRVSVTDNFYQRQPFEHLEDKIYRRLIRDFIEGAAMPEARVAALGIHGEKIDLRYLPPLFQRDHSATRLA